VSFFFAGISNSNKADNLPLLQNIFAISSADMIPIALLSCGEKSSQCASGTRYFGPIRILPCAS